MLITDLDRSRFDYEGAQVEFRVHGLRLTGTSCLIDSNVLTVEVTDAGGPFTREYDVHLANVDKITYGADL